MSSNIGISTALFIFVGLLIFSISYSDWECGKLISENCLRDKPKMPIILGLISGGGVLALLGAILYSVHIPNELNGPRRTSVVLAVLAAGCATAAIFYFYVAEGGNNWCPLITMFASGLGSGVMLCLLGTFCETLL